MWSFQDQSGESEYVRVKTGFPYFDNKTDLSGRDILEAKELGIQLFITREEYLKRQADTYKRQADTDRRLKKIESNFEALRSATELILHSRDNAGFWNGLARWAHRKTSGITPLSGELSYYDALDFSAASDISRALADGDATYEEERESREVYLTGFRSAKEQRKVLSGAIEELLENISQNMEKIEFKFLAVGAEERMVARYIMYSDISKYLHNTQIGRETFSYERFGNMLDYIEMVDENRFNYNEWKKIRGEINTDY